MKSRIASLSLLAIACILLGATPAAAGTFSFGDSLYQADFTFSGIPFTGAGFVTLSNACTTSGCSTEPVYWDENMGEGCTSSGCLSIAYESAVGQIPSETFTLTGAGGGGTTPEPSSVLLLASGNSRRGRRGAQKRVVKDSYKPSAISHQQRPASQDMG